MALLIGAAACAEPAPSELGGFAARAGLLASAQELRLDATVQPSTTPGVQRSPTLVALPNGNRLVLWEDERRGDFDIWGAILDGTTARPAGPPFPLVLSPGHQLAPTVSCALSCIVAWEDQPTGRIAGTLLDGSGRLLLPATLADRPMLPRVLGEQRTPSIAQRAGDYFLVWQDVLAGGESNIFGAWVGELDAGMAVVVDARPGAAGQPRVAAASSASQWLVVWEEPDAGINGRRVGPNGVLDAAPFRIASATAGPLTDPVVTFGGQQWHVAWTQTLLNGDMDIAGARVDLDGGVVPLSIASGGEAQLSPSITASLTGTFVAWAQRGSGSSTLDIHGTELSPTKPLVSWPLATGLGDQTAPSLAADGNTLWVAWRDDRALDHQTDIYAARLSTPVTSAPVPTLVSVAPSEQTAVRIAGSPSGRYLAVWEDTRNPSNGSDVYGVLLDARGTRVTSLALATDEGPQAQPAVASNPTGFLVVFADGVTGGLRVRLVNELGVPAAVAYPVSTTAAPGRQHAQPDVVWDGDEWFIVYSDTTAGGSAVRGSRVSMAGSGPVPLTVRDALTTFATEPTVAVMGDVLLVAWSEKSSSEAGYDIMGRRYDKAGSPLEATPFGIAVAPGDQRHPAIGTDGTQFLVVWQDARSAGPAQQEIWGARVSREGALRDRPTQGVKLASALWPQARPTVAFDGVDFVVGWEDHRTPDGAAIWAERVRPSDLAHYPEERIGEVGSLAPSLAVSFNSPGIVGYHRADPRLDLGRVAFGRLLLGRGGASCNADADCQSGVCSAGACAGVDAGAVLFDGGPVVVLPDAGAGDAGTAPTDGGAGGGSGDGGTAIDGGQDQLSYSTTPCGCSSAEGVAVLGALLLVRRRARRTERNQNRSA